MVPVVFILATSFMTQKQALTSALIPHPFTPSNYTDVFNEIPFLRYTWNTTQVAVLATLGHGAVVRAGRLRVGAHAMARARAQRSSSCWRP